MCLKHIFVKHQIWGELPPNAPLRGYGPENSSRRMKNLSYVKDIGWRNVDHK